MKKEILIKNIENMKKWLKEKPNDEDYLRLLKEFEKELKQKKKNS
jgi:hypothetical protein